ncbi:MAG TPA: hypothetical protein VFX43_03060, partial [Chitinophagaceae bacterium]|nr:hypothetical protein [Chitinophagaceae bacterium]
MVSSADVTIRWCPVSLKRLSLGIVIEIRAGRDFLPVTGTPVCLFTRWAGIVRHSPVRPSPAMMGRILTLYI